MTQLRAFHGDPAVKKKYLARVAAHRKADELVQGDGWTGTKGCAVGCTLNAYDHSRYPIELGIPEWLARVEDKIFEGLSPAEAKKWPEAFLKAIKPGANLEKAKGPFLIFVLKSALKQFDHKQFPDVKKAVDGSIALWKRKDIGSAEWNEAAREAGDGGGPPGEGGGGGGEGGARRRRGRRVAAARAAREAEAAAARAAREAEAAAWGGEGGEGGVGGEGGGRRRGRRGRRRRRRRNIKNSLASF